MSADFYDFVEIMLILKDISFVFLFYVFLCYNVPI